MFALHTILYRPYIYEQWLSLSYSYIYIILKFTYLPAMAIEKVFWRKPWKVVHIKIHNFRVNECWRRLDNASGKSYNIKRLTMTVITCSGNSCASIANKAVTRAEHPRPSTLRVRKHITINGVPSGLISRVLKTRKSG